MSLSDLNKIPDYEKMLETLYTRILQPGDTVIDIGAHTGRHTFPLARAVAPSGKVFFFEPLPTEYQYILKKIEEFKMQHRKNSIEFYSFNCALGQIDGEASFIVAENYPEFSGLRKRQYHVKDVITKTIQVQIQKLDSLREPLQAVKFIKIDAEGGELQILRGGHLLIAEARPIISFELGEASLISYDYTSDDYYSFFEHHNYKIYNIREINLTRDGFIKSTKEQVMWDYIACPKEKYIF